MDQSLSRLADQGVIRRLTRGLYDYPKHSSRFGLMAPSADDIARAVARKDNQVLQLSPAMAANQLGLSTQVPSNPTYMTDGPTRTKKIGRQVIQFRQRFSEDIGRCRFKDGHCVPGSALFRQGSRGRSSDQQDCMCTGCKGSCAALKAEPTCPGLDASCRAADRGNRLRMNVLANETAQNSGNPFRPWHRISPTITYVWPTFGTHSSFC